MAAAATAAAAAGAAAAATAIKGAVFRYTRLRVKNADATQQFYATHFGMTACARRKSDAATEVFMTRVRAGDAAPPADLDSPAATAYVRSRKNRAHFWVFVQEHERDADAAWLPNNGNVEPHRGFGHVAFNTPDVYALSAQLEKAGVEFKKKPDEGRMKGLAFAYDPNRYWIELVSRADKLGWEDNVNVSQTMLRIKAPKLSVPFFRDVFGMHVGAEKHFEDAKFSLYFLASLGDGDEAAPTQPDLAWIKQLWQPVLELTHNHGTEAQDGPAYHNGNSEPEGFVDIGFSVDALDDAVAAATAAGASVVSKTDTEVVVAEPGDNYHVRIVQAVD